MSRKIIAITIFAVITATQFANAQISMGSPSFPGPVGRQVVPAPLPHFQPHYPQQYPVYVSPDQVTGINPYTGGFDTYNRQIDNTVYQIGRNESQGNGTKRWVRRPIYGLNGQITGYQEGYVWINSYTGQEHTEMSNFTPNGSGGTHHQISFSSASTPTSALTNTND